MNFLRLHWKYLSCGIGLLLLSTGFLHGQKSQISFQQWNRTSGLSQGSVYDILQDETGFIWIATQDGLNRFDGYEFEILRHNPRDPDSLSGNHIVRLYQDRKGELWVGTWDSGLNHLRLQENQVTHYRVGMEGVGLDHDRIRAVEGDSTGRLWIGTEKGLNLFDRERNRWKNFREAFANPAPSEALASNEERSALSLDGRVRSLLIDGRDRAWVGTGAGLDRIEIDAEWPETLSPRSIQRIALPGEAHGRITVTGLVRDHRGTLWIGTSVGLFRILQAEEGATTATAVPLANHRKTADEPLFITSLTLESMGDELLWIGTREGLIRYNPNSEQVYVHGYRPNDLHGLGHPHVRALLLDRIGNLWVGTESGLNVFARQSRRFVSYRHAPDNPNSLSNSTVWCFLEDRPGYLWVGTSHGLNLYDLFTDRVVQFQADPKNPKSLSDSRVYSLLKDDQDRLWVGTHRGLSLRDTEDSGFARFRHEPENPASLANNVVFVLLQDSRRDIWVGTMRGLHRWIPEQRAFERFQHDPDNELSLSGSEIMAALEDRPSRLWVGTTRGLNRFDTETGRSRRYLQDPGNPYSLSNHNILSLAKASDGTLWVGTKAGLNALEDAQQGRFRVFGIPQGFPSETIYGIVEDGRGMIWTSTNNGLVRLDPRSQEIQTFDIYDGLQGNEFNFGACYRNTSGSLFFGGPNGFNMIATNRLKDDVPPQPVVLTHLRLDNQRTTGFFSGQASEHTIAPLYLLDQLVLSDQPPVIGFDFTALYYSGTPKIRYAYKMEGFDEAWIETNGDRRTATYTRLPPGEYRFQVKSTDWNGAWGEPTHLAIHLRPPWWRTLWAMSLFAVLVVGMAIFGVQRVRARLLSERHALQRLSEMDRLKDQFLANTSHELRTPLNGIIGLTESLLDGAAGAVTPRMKTDLKMIVSSGHRLARLVDDILDYAKLKRHDLDLNLIPNSVKQTVDQVFSISKGLIGKKPLELINMVPEDFPVVLADPNRLQQILYNLIGNAIKFTDQGTVAVNASMEGDQASITVADTGCGIPESQVVSIFESFHQADGHTARVHTGTGIGLAVTKQLVELHGGRIWVHTKQGTGSTFFFTLPFAQDTGNAEAFFQTGDLADAHSPLADRLPAKTTQSFGTQTLKLHSPMLPGSPNILLVDDDPVNRKVLANHLSLRNYNLVEAVDGKQAISVLADRSDVHLVLLDIMMPDLSGYEVCTRIREQYSMQELPIIFLTAKNRSEDMVRAFKVGGNDFLSKPVSKPELLARIRTHLDLMYVNRNLESLVRARTEELQSRNYALDQKYREMETLNQIVQAINREIEFERVLETLLHQITSLFSQADRAFCFVFDRMKKTFMVPAAIGYPDSVFHFERSEEQLRALLQAHRREWQEGLFTKTELDVAQWEETGWAFTQPVGLLAMVLRLEDQLAGVIVLETLTPELAFGDEDLEKFELFRDHIITALIRARTMTDLMNAQNALVKTAHQAGMAEIASYVLHNMGNSLNSLGISCQLIQEHATKRKWLEMLEKLGDLLTSEEDRLSEFIVEDPRGAKIPQAVRTIASAMREHLALLDHEAGQLNDQVSTTLAILQQQWQHSRGEVLREQVDINELLEEALGLDWYLIQKHMIKVERDLQPVVEISLERAKVLRTFLCLLENARESVMEQVAEGKGWIRVATQMEPDRVVLTLSDNGSGIEPEVRQRVFNQGFSTKPGRHGFGLHYAAATMDESGGEIEVESDGTGTGCLVRLKFPLEPPKRKVKYPASASQTATEG
ncbi:two-component regulator propeller domain-containing protein [Sulfidibacter corallicola]|uniref:histidine kinase n=1 Tax=Sulfidibacter corallicola TaxID=2818388 RepID=A0A8A4TGN4_SULCO|nr:two-component regulator propeller domain-containing protein [Sulfidibacter corallicola]QTD49229.1 response regulator [Sulfidibacter corallicola]